MSAVPLTELSSGEVAQRPSPGFGGENAPDAPKSIAVLWDDGLLQLSGLNLSRDRVEQSLRKWHAVFLTPGEVAKALHVHDFDLFLDPFGPVFPLEIWESVVVFLREGGHWLHFGGTPFALPAQRDADSPQGWRVGEWTTAFHKQLGITQSFPVVISARDVTLSTLPFGNIADWNNNLSSLTVDELYVRLVSKTDMPGGDEWESVRQAVLNPLLVVSDKQGEGLAAPVIEIGHFAGTFAGGRWVMGTFRGTPSQELLQRMTERALTEMVWVTVSPSFACYHQNETVSLNVHVVVPSASDGTTVRLEGTIEVVNGEGKGLSTVPLRLEGKGSSLEGSIDVPALPWKPGLHGVYLSGGVQADKRAGVEVSAENGFWLFDDVLFRSGPDFGVSKDYITRDGKPYPVTGTTYMSSSAHRHFLLDPNPWEWERDFAAIKNSGANMVRTGIWTGWNSIAPKAGHVTEPALRAWEAYLLTARSHDIPVIFTLFAFLPPTWGGQNPYLDPASVAAQAAFVEAFAARSASVHGVMWDLINEPSFCSAPNLWKCRPNYDPHEAEAWRAWVAKQTVVDRPGGRTLPLADIWRERGIDPLKLPALDDFIDDNILSATEPAKAGAYRRFSQEAFARWAKHLHDRIAAHGSASQLVTVGQDEGGTWERPSPKFFAPSVDFTCNHTWWLNDDLLWDGIMSRTSRMPDLIEETGVMFYTQANGLPWRTEYEARDLLERKMAMAFAGGGAGFLQWLWNTNVLQPSDNEVAIGFLRADGTAKPELGAFQSFAAIIREHAGEFGDRRQEEVVMVIPYSNLYAVRSVTLDATKRCVRSMEYACDTAMRAVSEYRLDDGLQGARLIVVPSAGMMREESWQKLLSAARQGATLLVTGHLERDEDGRRFPRFASLGIDVEIRPVSSGEDLEIDGRAYQATFRGEKIQQVDKGVDRNASSQFVHRVPLGSGNLLWMPLPLEASDDTVPGEALYRFALREAGVQPYYMREAPDPSVLIRPVLLPQSTMYVLINESSTDKTVRFTPTITGKPVEVNVKAGRTAVIFARVGQ